MPQAFLAEVLEWNETLEQARNSPATPEQRARLEALGRNLAEERVRSLQSVAAQLTPLPLRASPPLREVRARLNAIRYLDRALFELEGLRLAHASLG